MEELEMYFEMKDYAKQLLFNTYTEEQERVMRYYINKIDDKIKKLIIPIA